MGPYCEANKELKRIRNIVRFLSVLFGNVTNPKF